jgi:hypothetical protein
MVCRPSGAIRAVSNSEILAQADSLRRHHREHRDRYLNSVCSVFPLVKEVVALAPTFDGRTIIRRADVSPSEILYTEDTPLSGRRAIYPHIMTGASLMEPVA